MDKIEAAHYDCKVDYNCLTWGIDRTCYVGIAASNTCDAVGSEVEVPGESAVLDKEEECDADS